MGAQEGTAIRDSLAGDDNARAGDSLDTVYRRHSARVEVCGVARGLGEAGTGRGRAQGRGAGTRRAGAVIPGRERE